MPFYLSCNLHIKQIVMLRISLAITFGHSLSMMTQNRHNQNAVGTVEFRKVKDKVNTLVVSKSLFNLLD